MAKKQNGNSRLRNTCLSLPEAVETIKWGEPHFCVAEKIFAGCDNSHELPIVGFKMSKADAKQLVKMPGCSPAPYVGRHGWVSIDTSIFKDWETIEAFIIDSYRMIAPKRLSNQLSQDAESED